MEGLVYLVAFIALSLAASAQWKLREHNQRLKELEEPIKQKKRDEVLLARAEMLVAEERSKKTPASNKKKS